MNTLDALFFPGTELYSASQYPVLLLVDTLHFLQPVESTDNSPDIFVEQGRCQAHTPAPLGDQYERFLRLIRDIQERKDDYAAQLSGLTLAAFSERRPSLEDTTQGIVASLLDGHGVIGEKDTDPDMLLWQARLVLKIGEILDREEEDIARQMTILDDEEIELFSSLQGELAEEGESLAEELQQLTQKISRPSSHSQKNRLLAWSRLYLRHSTVQPHLWLTAFPEAAHYILDRHLDTDDFSIPLLAEIPLPANLGWSKKQAAEAIASYQASYSQVGNTLRAAIQDAHAQNIAAAIEAWSASLDAMFPENTYGRSSLALYTIKPRNCAEIIGCTDGSRGGDIIALLQQT